MMIFMMDGSDNHHIGSTMDHHIPGTAWQRIRTLSRLGSAANVGTTYETVPTLFSKYHLPY